jgi:hypothetical protein
MPKICFNLLIIGGVNVLIRQTEHIPMPAGDASRSVIVSGCRAFNAQFVTNYNQAPPSALGL